MIHVKPAKPLYFYTCDECNVQFIGVGDKEYIRTQAEQHNLDKHSNELDIVTWKSGHA